MKYKAEKVETYRDKYCDTVVYSYRGRTYEVTYSKCWTYCVTPAWVQHKAEQEKIDEAIDNPKPETEAHPFDLDELFSFFE